MCKGEVICDLAETYGIYNYKGLPVETLATLIVGLRDNSRTKMFLADIKVSTETLLLGTIADRLALLLWANTEDGRKGINRPKSIVAAWVEPKESEFMSFRTIEDFENYRKSIIEKGK